MNVQYLRSLLTKDSREMILKIYFIVKVIVHYHLFIHAHLAAHMTILSLSFGPCFSEEALDLTNCLTIPVDVAKYAQERTFEARMKDVSESVERDPSAVVLETGLKGLLEGLDDCTGRLG